MIEAKSYLTAISRKSLPVPTQWLHKNGLLVGNVLDYGCGKCEKLNREILGKDPQITTLWNYDPYFHPYLPTVAKFDTIICNYVLCVVPKNKEKDILRTIQDFLKTDGIAYISVRNDVPKQGYGISNKNTYQRKVTLNLPLVRECRNYGMYKLTTQDRI